MVFSPRRLTRCSARTGAYRIPKRCEYARKWGPSHDALPAFKKKSARGYELAKEKDEAKKAKEGHKPWQCFLRFLKPWLLAIVVVTLLIPFQV
jgi:hypothetical protein